MELVLSQPTNYNLLSRINQVLSNKLRVGLTAASGFQMEPRWRKQAFLPKVRTGCLTCKARKVKCDESKPQCHRCTASGRVCSGYQPRQALAPAPGQQVEHGMSAWLGSDLEKRSFGFFLTRASQRFGGFFHGSFWSREVLQAAIRYPSIRHLVVALGAAYEQFESKEPDRISNGTDDDDMRFTLQQCNHSIRHITSLVGTSPQSPETMCCILTGSILFAIFASLQANFAQAIGHVRSGLRVMQDLESLGASHAFPVPIARLRSLLTSLYAQIRAMINDEARVEWPGYDPLVSHIEPVACFLLLADAQSYVEALFTNALAFFQRTGLRPPVTPEQTDAVAAERHDLCCALRSSCDALDAYVARDVCESNPTAIALLRLYHTMLSLQLGLSAFQDDKREGLFDDAEQDLVQMLEYCRFILQDDNSSHDATAKQPVYSSALGVIMPLHMVAARCRNPITRQRAVDLLLRARRREWLWDSTLAGKIVSTTIGFEQKGLATDDKQLGNPNWQRIPDDARVREVKLHFESERSAQVEFITVGQRKNKESGYRRFIQW